MISFIILTWNSSKYIYNCINSLISLKVDSEIIVVDNGSNDDTLSILKEIKSSIKMIKLEKNYGTTYPRNIGIRSISDKSEYICILDSDTIIREGTIEKLVAALEMDVTLGVVSPFLYYGDGVMQKSYKRFPTVQTKLFKACPVKVVSNYGERLEREIIDERDAYNYIDYSISACWLIRKEVINAVGLLDENIFYAPEDVDFCLRVWKYGYKVAIVSGTYVTHFTQRISKRKLLSKMNLEHIKGLIYYFKKHKYFFSVSKIYSLINRNSIH